MLRNHSTCLGDLKRRTPLNVDSTDLGVDDQFLNPPEDDDYEDGDEFYTAVEHSECISQKNSQPLEPIIEAQVLS